MTIFPPSIRENSKDRPVIIFKRMTTGDSSDMMIAFPIPQSIQFNDSAAYNPTEIGFSGSMIVTALKSSDINAAKSSLSNQLSNVSATVPGNLPSLAGLLGSTLLPRGELKSAVGIGLGTAMNRNIVTEFSGVGTRQFSFQFKLISTSSQESDIIRTIAEAFRDGLYPEGDSIQLKYPPTWRINFMKGGADIAYIPKIFETYLINLTSSYNSTMNLFHEDGSPVELDLQVTFMESRALVRSDIQTLKGRSFRHGDASASNMVNTKAGLVNAFNRPTTTTPRAPALGAVGENNSFMQAFNTR